MADTQTFEIGATPVELISTRSLADGNWEIQNVGSSDIFMAERSAPLTEDEAALLPDASFHILGYRISGLLVVQAGAAVYAWCPNGDGLMSLTERQ